MRIRYDIGPGEEPSVALVRVVAELVGAGPLEMDPLSHLVDLDGLDRLLDGPAGPESMSVSVRIELDQHVLSIRESAIVVEAADGVLTRQEAPPGDGRDRPDGRR